MADVKSGVNEYALKVQDQELLEQTLSSSNMDFFMAEVTSNG